MDINDKINDDIDLTISIYTIDNLYIITEIVQKINFQKFNVNDNIKMLSF